MSDYTDYDAIVRYKSSDAGASGQPYDPGRHDANAWGGGHDWYRRTEGTPSWDQPRPGDKNYQSPAIFVLPDFFGAPNKPPAPTSYTYSPGGSSGRSRPPNKILSFIDSVVGYGIFISLAATVIALEYGESKTPSGNTHANSTVSSRYVAPESYNEAVLRDFETEIKHLREIAKKRGWDRPVSVNNLLKRMEAGSTTPSAEAKLHRKYFWDSLIRQLKEERMDYPRRIEEERREREAKDEEAEAGFSASGTEISRRKNSVAPPPKPEKAPNRPNKKNLEKRHIRPVPVV
jgi:hypothetical protein